MAFDKVSFAAAGGARDEGDDDDDDEEEEDNHEEADADGVMSLIVVASLHQTAMF